MFSNTLQPELDQVMRAPGEAAVAVYRSFPADTETPVSAFLKLRQGGVGFLLESAEQDGSLGRYSFIGVRPDALLRADLDRGTVETEAGLQPYEGEPFGALRRLVAGAVLHREDPELPAFLGGAVGVLSYDLARSIETLPDRLASDPPFPAALFGRYDTLVIFDHLKHRLLVTSVIPPGHDRVAGYRRAQARVDSLAGSLRRAAPPAPFEPSPRLEEADRLMERAEQLPDDATFLKAVARARDYIRAGEAIQVVLSRRLSLPLAGDPFRLYRALRILSPSPYMFFLEFSETTLIGASPEMLLRTSGNAAQLCPIAGTRPRGADPEEDARLEAELLADPKERAEHVMLVDLGRNDLGRVCRPGSVHVPTLMHVERYSHVQHLVSTITGRLGPGTDALDALRACFPAGTVSGAPKVRAMEIIEELEPRRRGPYAGAVGYVGFGSESLDTCIAIRTAVVNRGRVYLQTGAGIVADSDPESEKKETEAKARGMLAALSLAGVDERGAVSNRPQPKEAGA